MCGGRGDGGMEGGRDGGEVAEPWEGTGRRRGVGAL